MKVNELTGLNIQDISNWYDAFGLTFNLGKGDYLIMGIKDGSSLNLNKSNFVIYTREDDFKNIVNAKIDAEDLVLIKNGNQRDPVRPNTVKCNTKETLRTLLKIYAMNFENRKKY